jgi:hypothetical protein
MAASSSCWNGEKKVRVCHACVRDGSCGPVLFLAKLALHFPMPSASLSPARMQAVPSSLPVRAASLLPLSLPLPWPMARRAVPCSATKSWPNHAGKPRTKPGRPRACPLRPTHDPTPGSIKLFSSPWKALRSSLLWFAPCYMLLPSLHVSPPSIAPAR